MILDVKQNREIIMINAQNTQNENEAEKITLIVPEKYQDFNKKIVFETDDGIVWDVITNNEYLINKAITKYNQVNFYIWLTQGDVDFRTKTKTLRFYNNEDASEEITPEEISGVNTVVNLLEQEIDRVENIDIEAEKISTTTTITITKKDGTTQTVEIYDGINGQDGKDGEDYVLTELDKAEISNMTANILRPTIPTKTSQLTNDSNFVSDQNYVHTDNNYTTTEKTKLAGLENYDDTQIQADISAIEEEQTTQNQNIQALENLIPTDTIQGESIDLTDSAEYKFKSIEVYGNTTQDGTPTPENPVAINNVTGDNEIIVQNKNLIPNSSNIDLTTNANITLLDFGKDITFDSITLSFYMKNAKYTTNGNIACLQKNDNSTNYQSTTSFGMTAETVLNGKYSKTLTNITFRYLILYARTTSYVSWQQGTCDIQLEAGTTASDYIAHAEQTVTFPLGTSKMYEGDYLADDGIHHTKNRQQYQSIVGGYNSSNNWFYWDTSVAMYSPYNKTVLCNYLKYYDITTFSGRNSLTGISINPSGTYVLLRNTSLTTAQEYKDWVASLYQNNTPLELEYELAEEVIEPYNTAQQTAWNNIKEFYTYQGITHISQENDNIPFKLKIVYRQDIKKYVDETVGDINTALESILGGGN